jgi:hypothetical protein
LHNSVDNHDFVVGDKKPGVDDYGKEYKYSPGDKVWLCVFGQREGPYKVESAEDGKYTLCDEYGISAKGGNAFDEGDLELHDPFN